MSHRHTLIGIAAALGMLALFFGLLSLFNSFAHALNQFSQLWPWVITLSAGFGFQMALFSYARAYRRANAQAATGMAATGGISTASMAACCAHHAADVLPFLGLSAAAVLLNQFQSVFLMLGAFSAIAGSFYMLSIMQKHRLGMEENRVLSPMARLPFRNAFAATILVAAFSLTLATLLALKPTL